MRASGPRFFAPWFSAVLLVILLLIWVNTLTTGAGVWEPLGMSAIFLTAILLARWVYLDAVKHRLNAAAWSLFTLLFSPIVIVFYLMRRRSIRRVPAPRATPPTPPQPGHGNH